MTKPFSFEEASQPAAPFSHDEAQGKTKGFASDAVNALKQGALQIPGALTGLADIPAAALGFNRPFSRAAEALGDLTGFKPGQWAKDAEADYSQATQAGKAEIDAVWEDPNAGALDVAKAYATNPRVTALNAIQSIPSMLAGGVGGRVVGGVGGIASAPIRAGIGEGAVMAGQSMADIDPSVDPQRAAAAAAAVGAGGAALGALGGRAAQRLGILDVDTAIAGGTGVRAKGVNLAKRVPAGALQEGAGGTGVRATGVNLAKRVPAGALQEGVFEELPQTLLETAGKNWAEEKPLTEGLARAGVEGALAGGLMGGVAGLVPAPRAPVDPKAPPPGVDPANAGAPGSAPAAPPVPPAPTVPPAPVAPAPVGPFVDPSLVDPNTGELVRPPATAAPEALAPTELAPVVAPPVAPGAPPTIINPNAGAMSRAAAIALGAPPAPPTPTVPPVEGGQGMAAPAIPTAAPTKQGDPNGQGQEEVLKPEAAGVEPAAPAAPTASFASEEEAASYISKQRRAGGMRISALPMPNKDGTFGIAIKGTPDYTVAEFHQRAKANQGLGVLDDDILAKDGAPFKNAVQAGKVKREAGDQYQVVKLAESQFVVRKAAPAGAQASDSVPPVSPTTVNQPKEPSNASKQEEAAQAQPGAPVGAAPNLQNVPSSNAVGQPAAATSLATVPEGGQQPASAPVARAIDEAAHEAATSPLNEKPQPTDAQKEAGNYKVGRIKVGGLDLSIENPAGSVRRGTDRDGKAWENTLQHHYGYIRRSEGNDGDHVDAFVKPGTPEDWEGTVFVVDQVHPDTKAFDEHKAMVGFDSLEDAKQAYRANYAKDWRGMQAISALPMGEFKTWVMDREATKQPLVQVSQPTSVIDKMKAAKAQAQSRVRSYGDLEVIAERRGIKIFKAGGGWHAGPGSVDVPDEDVDVTATGAVSPAHVLAHELGHAIMQKRGISFAGFPRAEVVKRVPNWDDMIAASKAFRPAVHAHENAKYRKHALKPNEVMADAIGAVLLGTQDIALIRPLMEAVGLSEIDLGLMTADEYNASKKPAAQQTEQAAPADGQSPEPGKSPVNVIEKMKEKKAEKESNAAAPIRLYDDDGTLKAEGDPKALKDQLTAAGIPARSVVSTAGGVIVGKTQAEKARAVLEQASAPEKAVEKPPTREPKLSKSERVDAPTEKENPTSLSTSDGQVKETAESERVASLFGGGPDPKNSPPMQALDGFKVGDRVHVKGRTFGEGRITLLFTRAMAGFDEPSKVARLESSDGKSPIDVQTFELEAVVDAPAKRKPAPEPKKVDQSPEVLRAQADLNNALADMADLFGKNFRANIVPIDEQKFIPILTRLMDAAFRLGYLKFKAAAKFALDTIREKLGADVADAITLDHLQGAYIGMAGGKVGADRPVDVVKVEAKGEIEQFIENSDNDQQEAPNEQTQGPTTEPRMGEADPRTGEQAGGGRGTPSQQPAAQADSDDLAGAQPDNVAPPGGGGPDAAPGDGATGADVGSAGGASSRGSSRNGRAGTGRKRKPDAGAGSASAAPATGGLFDGGGVEPSPANPGPTDFVISDPLRIVGGGQVARFEKNKAAIELRNSLIESGRALTLQDQETLAGYTGWGSFGQELFQGDWEHPKPKAGWEDRDRWLRDNLGRKDWEGMRDSIINAHYTDPPTVMAMWDMVRRMGFQGGRILEPSLGIGNFYGMMPSDLAARSQRSGIELDPVTGSMAQMLYPNANIQIKGYEKSATPDNFYDLVIGNWPFSEISPADRRYNRISPTLHDYFFLKAIDQVKPGGIVIGITTKGTMDKKGVTARMEMARKAELVAAFRLPTGAFAEYAGTAVVTDIIILRKRDKPTGIVDKENWIEVLEHDTPEGTKVLVNKYFHDNPSHVIGTINFGHGTTTFRPGLIVDRPDNMLEQLRRIVDLVPVGAFRAEQGVKHISYVANHTSDRTNALVKTPKGLFIVAGEHLAAANDVLKYELKDADKTAERVRELESLISMRQLYGKLIDAERIGDADGPRKALRAAYEAFVKAHGPLSSSFGLNYLHKIDDPFYPSLAALEVRSDGKVGKTVYRPATILTESTMRGARAMANPSIKDAFVLARGEAVNPSLARIAELAKKTEAEVKADLVEAGAAFDLPNGDFAPSDVYLSGNVRQKMREAKAALEDGNEAMRRNIAALEKVMPPDVPYYKIETQMGATWVPPSVYADFVAHALGLENPTNKDDIAARKTIEVGFKAGAWLVDFDAPLNHRPQARSGFGSNHVTFKRLVRAAIANQTITVKFKDSDGVEHVDDEATKEVNSKIADMRMKFGEWLWKDPVRRVQLETEYNEVRNAYAEPKFDGSFLAFQGMALTLGRGPFNMREHQANAIWRGLVTRKSLNAHEVGTGKTFTMGGIAVESRRYGIAKKPMLLAHNANSKSVAHEIQQMYPSAKVLYVDNLSKENVKTRMMQIANDDWDVVVIPHSVIDRIGFKEETLMGMAQEELMDLSIAAEDAAAEDGATITPAMWEDEEELKKLRSPTAKQLVKQRLKIISTIQKLSMQASKDGAVSFEDLGVDMLLVDEAHEFKKPPLATKMRMKGLQTSTSDRSIAMMFLTRYVRANNNGANVHLFTGTPITNTMTEVFHMMRYMMQEEMKESALADWDGWFGSFAREVNDVELNPAGEYEAVTRLQSFINVPELRRMIGQYMDVVFAEDMPEMQLRLVDGKRLTDNDISEATRKAILDGRTENAADRPYKKVINESSDMTPEQMVVFERVQGWARAWRNMAKKDRKEAMNMGAPESPIIHENIAARASFDVRLVDAIKNAGLEGRPEMEPHPQSKPARVLANLLSIYHSSSDAAQVVFMEQGMARQVTRREGPIGMKRDVRYPAFSTVVDMIERLVQAGIPREQIALVDGSTSKDKRKEVADGMNDGRIRIVFGSTDSLGVGVNMQRNLRAMHHMDAPWMPGELEQRNGRGHRQGNQWNTVFEFRYLTDRLDGRRWQVLAIKQRFITDFMKSKGDVRVIEGDAASDEGGDILSTFSEAAGDPRVLLREKFKKKVEQLNSRERMHSQAVSDAVQSVKNARTEAESVEKRLAAMRKDGVFAKLAGLVQRTAGDGFNATIGGEAFTDRGEANDALSKWLTDNIRLGDDKEVGEFGSEPLYAHWEFKWQSGPSLYMRFGHGLEVTSNASFGSLESSLRSSNRGAESGLVERAAEARATMGHAEKVAAEPFHLGKELEAAKKRLADLIDDLARNPVAPPFWLRAGAPTDTAITWNDRPFVVTGHRWGPDGWFVLAEDSKGEVSIPYMQAKDAQGMPLYEEREFTPPTVQQGAGAANAPVNAPVAPKNVTVMAGANITHTGAPEANDTDVVFGGAMFSRGPFYSSLRQSIEKINAKALPPGLWKDGIRGLLNKGAVKADEVEWSGIREWLDLQIGKVSKEDVLAYLDANGVQVQEVVLGQPDEADIEALLNDEAGEGMTREDAIEYLGNDEGGNPTKYDQYQLPGGQNYREVLLTLPSAETTDQILARMKAKYPNWKEGQSYKTVLSEADQRDLEAASEKTKQNYRSSHWDTPNVLAHIRVNDRESVEVEPLTPEQEADNARRREGMARLKDLRDRMNKLGKEVETQHAAGWARLTAKYRPMVDAGEMALSDMTSRIVKELPQSYPQSVEKAKLQDEFNTIAKGLPAQHTPRTTKQRVLFVEEIQSDWGQSGKRDGFSGNLSIEEKARKERIERDGNVSPEDHAWYNRRINDATVPSAPFVTHTDKWLTLALKRIMVMAAQEGYDRVAFVNGEQSAERYSLDKHVGSVTYVPGMNGGTLLATDLGDNSFVIKETNVTPEKVADFVGKDVAEKLMAQPIKDGSHKLTGSGLKVPQGGMRAFYDVILPSVLKDVLRKLGGDRGSIHQIKIPRMMTGDEYRRARNNNTEMTDEEQRALDFKMQPGFDITPEMRERLVGGMPLFRAQGQTGGMSVEAARKIIDAKVAKWTNGPRVVVVATPKDLPMRAPDDANGVYHQGTVYIVAGAHRSPGQVLRTLAHEAVAHYGLRGMLGDGYKKFLAQMQMAIKMGNKPLNAIRDDVRSRYRDEDGRYNLTELQEADEIAARAIEMGLDENGEFKTGFGWLKSWFAKIAQFLRELGITIPVTNAELQGMLVNAQRFVRGRADGTGVAVEPAPAFARDGAIDVDGVQRPRTNSQGQPIHPTEEGIKNFWRWFGDSLVVDDEGRPLVVYHGTAGDFSSFDPNKLGSNTGAKDARMGFWFSSDAEHAGNFNASNVANRILPVYLGLKNPLVVDHSTLDASVAHPRGEKYESSLRTDAISKAKKAGHDGVIFKNTFDSYAARSDMSGAYRVDLYVAFRPAQIKSATGNSGAFDGGNDDIAFSRGSIDSTLKATVQTSIHKTGNTLADYRGLALGSLGRRQLVDLYTQDLPQLPRYSDLVQRMDADKNEAGAEADSLARRWAALKDERQLAELMHDATLEQIDPEKARPRTDAAGEQIKYDQLRRQFLALSDEAKKVYVEARESYLAHHKKVRAAIRMRVLRSELSGARKAEILARLDAEFFKAIEGVYFPLARFGDYVVLVRDERGTVVSVSRAETINEAEALQAQLRKEWPDYSVSKVIKDREFNAGRDSVGRGFMETLFEAFDQQDLSADQRAGIEDMLGQLYLSSLPDLSWAKHGIHRKGTPGFSQDARRAFAMNMFHGARYLAKVRYSDLMDEQLAGMQKHVGAQESNGAYDSVRAQQVVDEMVKRHDSMMNPKTNALSTALTSVGFVFHLGLSPASAMVNLSQTALVAYPLMGAKWGYGKASAALLRASAEAAKFKNDLGGALKGDEKKAFDEAVRAGTIDVTMAHDLAGIAQGEDQRVAWRLRPVMRWASFLFHHAERFNRQVTFLAAYRLARGAGVSHVHAYEQATQATYDGHFDYSASNRPRFMQGNVAKVVLLFKQYAQNMIYTLARQAQLSITGTKEQKAEARKALAGLLTMHGAAAGVLGLPLVSPLLAAASMLGGGDDEPWDAEVALRNMLADAIGQKPAEVLTRGFSRLTPWDISARVGLDHLILPDVQEGLEGRRFFESAATAMLGPVAGIGLNVGQGLQEISQGQFARGLETMMPSALRGPMRAIRYADQGAQDKTGVTLVDEVGAAGIAGQALGLRPSNVALATEGKSAIYQADRRLGERRAQLLREYAMAVIEGEDSQDQRAAIREFNAKNPDRRINPLQMAASVKSRRKRIDEAEQGVYLPRNRREAQDAGRFAVAD